MTNEYSLIVPAMLATMLALLITGNHSIYEEQVPTRLDSPAHKGDYALPLLQQIRVSDVAEPIRAPIDLGTDLATIRDLLERHSYRSLLVIHEGSLRGIVTADDLARHPRLRDTDLTAQQIMTRAVAVVAEDATLYTAWLRMTQSGFKHLPVVAVGDPEQVVGEVTLATIGRVLQLPGRQPPSGLNAEASPPPESEPLALH